MTRRRLRLLHLPPAIMMMMNRHGHRHGRPGVTVTVTVTVTSESEKPEHHDHGIIRLSVTRLQWTWKCVQRQKR